MIGCAAQLKGCLGPLSLVAALFSVVGTARAQDENGPFVQLEAPEGCPAGGEFRDQLVRYLGGAEAARGVHIEVRITRTEEGFELTWRMQSEDVWGERTLSGADCAVLVETAALTAALAIDPNAVDLGDTDPGSFARDDDEKPGELESIPDRLTEVPETDLTSHSRRKRLLGLILRIAIGGDSGGMPGAFAPWVGGAIGPRFGLWRLEFTYSRWFEQKARVGDDVAEGGYINLWATAFRACRDIGQLGVTWSACLGVEGGKMAGRGFGGESFAWEANSDVWMATSGALAGSWKLAKALYLRTEAQLAVPARRLRFFIGPPEDPTVVHQPWYLNLRLFTGLELQFR